MCMRVTCPQCQKPTWSGCGRHVEQVLSSVAEADRCQCNSERRDESMMPWWSVASRRRDD
jgi:hypothetical protein